MIGFVCGILFTFAASGVAWVLMGRPMVVKKDDDLPPIPAGHFLAWAKRRSLEIACNKAPGICENPEHHMTAIEIQDALERSYAAGSSLWEVES